MVDTVNEIQRITFTDAAVQKVRELLEGEVAGMKLRIFVQGGGCSGFQYGFTFDDVAEADDAAIEKDGVTFLIDPMSLQYLAEANVDYEENLEGSQFVIKNPNATTTCGCGASFSA